MRPILSIASLVVAVWALFQPPILSPTILSNTSPVAALPQNASDGYTIYMPIISTPTPTALFRSGQTFITWPERTDLKGEVYKIYRSNQPITGSNYQDVQLLAKVGKGSANFYENRYNAGGPTGWTVRYTDRLVITDGGPQVSPNWGLLVWTLSTLDFNGGSSGQGYYAITVTPAGGKETFNSGYALGPVSEAVDNPRPVEITSPGGISIGEGGHAYIQYMDLRTWNATFHAPNSTNQYYGLDPSDPNLANDLQYAYDYDLFPPYAPDCPGGVVPDKVPVFFHLHGHRGITKSGEYDYPDKACAYGIYPFDVTDTWYFGFAQNYDYRKGGNPGDNGKPDTIVNYTEQRLLRMLADLERNPPGPAVDVERVYVAGQSMGGTGSMSLAQRYPNVFAAAYASQPMTNFRTAGTAKNGTDWIQDATIKWGAPSFNFPVYFMAPNGWADHLQKYRGMGVWDWEDLQAAAGGSRSMDEMALLGITHGTEDTVVWFNTQGAPTYQALDDGKRPWAGMINSDIHEWQYYNGLPPAISKLNGVPFWGLRAIRDETVPGFSNMKGMTLPPTGTGNFYQTIIWSSSWLNWNGTPVDQPDIWQMSFCAVAVGSMDCGSGPSQYADITLRRLQHFVVKPNASYHWTVTRINNRVGLGDLGVGNATADSNGILTIPNVTISFNGSLLTVTPN